MRLSRLGLCCLILCLLSSVALAGGWTPGSFPNPIRDLQKCGRQGPDGARKASWICDPDNILSEGGANEVEGIMADIAKGTSPYVPDACMPSDTAVPGYMVAVALMQRMHVPAGRSAQEQAEVFAETVHNSWGVGDAACSNGVLLLLSVQDRVVYISVGKGTARSLDHTRLQWVIDAMRPKLRAGKYDGAVAQGVADVGLILAGEAPDIDQGESGWFDWLAGGAVLGLFGAVIGRTCWTGAKRRRESRRCKELLEKLKHEQEHAMRHSRYPAASCPICFDDLVGAEELENSASIGNAGGKHDSPPSTPVGSEASSSKAPTRPADTDSEATALLKERLKDTQKSAKVDKKKPLALPCGHTFCEPCLSRWLDQNNSCPICREALTALPPQQAPPPSGVAQQVRENALEGEMYAAELLAFASSSRRRPA
eukprot:jgi/Astpho2/9350/fgenesh1_pg.00142_%23_25_t